ncbi:LYR motif-containing protein 9 [Lingula anatina]|uniref:LYR motif-containing protein 9 n=1 Tax=Lingula anatina TaxID=7574 RepID=A0A1S3H3G8_LINAN|nr:LYR motif-containing protein 9 [Lingula anatina]|eukprot:XP_013380021.1 LYR motif-containing protein 9 [Lingula anatina]
MSSKNIKTPVQLYMHLLRQVRKLPKEAQPYYKNYVRQGFNSHSDEDDPERIQMIIERSVKDAEWIVNKYTKNET